MLEAPQIKRTQRAIRADRDKDVRRVGQPRNVVHFTVVCDELRHRSRRIQIPNRTRRVDRGCDHETRNLLVP